MPSLKLITNAVSKRCPISLQARCVSSAAPAAVNKSKPKPRQPVESKSFIMNLFCGQLKTDQVFPYPDVLDEDQKQMTRMFSESSERMFRDNLDSARYDAEGQLDEAAMKTISESGGLGFMVPEEYGGMGANATQYARMAELPGRYDLGVSITMGAHQSIGYKGLLLYGSEEQKKKYLPDLVTGKMMACFCLTEPSSGSDASSIRTRAELSADGSHWILNGSKIWISNGGIAEFFTVFAQTPSTNKAGEKVDKVTAFIVERKYGGVSHGPPEKKMGIKCSNTAEVYFDNVKIPLENVLGEVGDGFKVAMNILNSGRFGMSAALSGTMRTLIEQATDFATNRVQFGSTISTYETTMEKIARMQMSQYITESLAYLVAGTMDRGHTEFQLEAAVSKVYSSEAAWRVCDETIQILGGTGYMTATGTERIMRDLRIFRIFEGTNDILRLFIALTGLQYAGGHLKELQKALKNPVANFGIMLDEGTKRMFRKIGISSAPSLQEHVDISMKDSGDQVSKCIEVVGVTVENLLAKYNKDIIHEQFLLNRLADSIIDIYTMMTVLSRATNAFQKGFPSAQIEAQMVKVICDEGYTRVMNNLASVRNKDHLAKFAAMRIIANRVYKEGGIITTHPIDELSA